MYLELHTVFCYYFPSPHLIHISLELLYPRKNKLPIGQRQKLDLDQSAVFSLAVLIKCNNREGPDGSCFHPVSNGEDGYASACKEGPRICLGQCGRNIDRRRDVVDFVPRRQRHAGLRATDRQSLRLLPSESGRRRRAQVSRCKIQGERP